jgi:hypothetical protein
VGKQIVDIPSFIVRLDSQKHIDFALTSPYGGGRPGRVKRKRSKAAEVIPNVFNFIYRGALMLKKMKSDSINHSYTLFTQVMFFFRFLHHINWDRFLN